MVCKQRAIEAPTRLSCLCDSAFILTFAVRPAPQASTPNRNWVLGAQNTLVFPWRWRGNARLAPFAPADGIPAPLKSAGPHCVGVRCFVLKAAAWFFHEEAAQQRMLCPLQLPFPVLFVCQRQVFRACWERHSMAPLHPSLLKLLVTTNLPSSVAAYCTRVPWRRHHRARRGAGG